jgi:predicted ArsR family transcriptional regulator
MSATAAALSARRQRPHWLDAIADPVRLQILRTLSRVPEATAAELAAQSQASNQTLRRHLDALETAGVIQVRPGRSDGETSGRPPARFSLTPDVRESVRAAFGA